jgi:hypothetical protein
MKDDSRVTDAFTVALARAHDLVDGSGLVGFGVVELRGPDGELKQVVPFANLITTAGDEYYAKKGIVGVSPANPSAPTVASGMKLGTGTTAAAKSGAGAALVTYETASNNPFDATFPSAAAVGGDGGWNATYKTTWAAGDVTETALTEAVICTDAAVDESPTAAETISRVVFSAVNKGASDSLAITWTHKFLGA